MKIKEIKLRLLFEAFPQPVRTGRGLMPGRDIILTEIDAGECQVGLSYITGLHMGGGAEIKVILAALQEALAPMLLGEDPLYTQRLWHLMYKETKRFGRRGAVLRALSALDLALWDLVAKKANLSITNLLGPMTDRLVAYASGGQYGSDADLVTEMERYLAQGFRAIKIRVGGASLARDTERLQLVRSTVGDSVILMVDAGEAWDLQTAIKAATRWEHFDLAWIEEPLSADLVSELREIRRRSTIPIAAGESVYTRYAFRDFVDARALDVMQPDVTRLGGVTEWIRVAHLASVYEGKLAPHGAQELHVPLMAAADRAYMVELFDRQHPFQILLDRIFPESNCATALEDGSVRVLAEPGFGLVVDWDAVQRYQVSEFAIRI